MKVPFFQAPPAFPQHPKAVTPVRHYSHITCFRKHSSAPLLALPPTSHSTSRTPQDISYHSEFSVLSTSPSILESTEGKDLVLFMPIFPHKNSFWALVSSKQIFVGRMNYPYVGGPLTCVRVCVSMCVLWGEERA